jgi:hypothetical protein
MGKYRKIDNAAEKDEEQQNFLFESANDTELSK